MFKKAQPIWIKNKETEKNYFASFRAEVGSLCGAEIHIAAAFFYRLFVNGRFVAFGPARTACGYTRKDIIPLSAYDRVSGKNEIVIEVAGYNCRSISTCLTTSFLCAEVRKDDKIIAFTGKDFIGYPMTEKEQKSERYSVQRHFGEIWDYTKPKDEQALTSVLFKMPKVIDRVAPYPTYDDVWVDNAAYFGKFEYDETLPCKNTRSSFPVSEYWGCFAEEDIPYKPFRWIQKQKQMPKEKNIDLPLTLHAGEYVLFDLKYINSGFLQMALHTHSKCDLVVGFTEYCENGIFAFTDINAQNVIEYVMNAEQDYEHISFEPYSLRFAVLMLKKGELTISSFGVKKFERDMTEAFKPKFNDSVLDGITEAAVRTFAHNAVDLFSDCPSRERAGWLCDSYFTAEAEYFFFGKTQVEDAFLQNYYLYPDNAEIPEGMLPMCYPADSKRTGERSYIPQWNMWYVLEVEEYINKRGAKTDKELFRHGIENFMDFLAKHENEDGLLENLPGWNFVEWSDANTWTDDVNYPTNFLYAGVLSAAYKLFGKEEWKIKAEKVKALTAERSFDGEMFTDNAVRENGVLKNTGNTSEACQYYAILFGGIDINDPKYAKLNEYVHTGCKGVAESGRRFVPVNAFIGLYLRIKALLKLEYYQILVDELGDFFGGMVEKTGTLWEYRQMKGSFDHGFASFVVPAIYTAVKKLNEK